MGWAGGERNTRVVWEKSSAKLGSLGCLGLGYLGFSGNIYQALTWGAWADHELSVVVFLRQAGELGLSKS